MIYLTGIKPTGQPHLGNYISVIEPLQKIKENDVFCFIADGHSLTTQPNPKELQENILNITAIYLTYFSNSFNFHLYRQSSIPEIFELFWILSCYTSKGLLNRCHAYYSLTQDNIEKGKDPDKGLFAGLFNYPVLMASDILLFNADKVPVGKDQKQHLEITKEVARKVNHQYKKDIFTLPQEEILTNKEIPGIDGRKMSKSYDNIIPLFCSKKKLKKIIFSIPTNSKNEGEIKYPEESEVISIFKILFPEDVIIDDMLKNGRGWGEIKNYVFESLWNFFEEKREVYLEYKNDLKLIYDTLEANEKKVRKIAKNNLHKIKNDIGLF